MENSWFRQQVFSYVAQSLGERLHKGSLEKDGTLSSPSGDTENARSAFMREVRIIRERSVTGELRCFCTKENAVTSKLEPKQLSKGRAEANIGKKTGVATSVLNRPVNRKEAARRIRRDRERPHKL